MPISVVAHDYCEALQYNYLSSSSNRFYPNPTAYYLQICMNGGNGDYSSKFILTGLQQKSQDIIDTINSLKKYIDYSEIKIPILGDLLKNNITGLCKN